MNSEKCVWGISFALLLLGLLFMPGCMCFATPDCFGAHEVTVRDEFGLVVEVFTARLEGDDGVSQEWDCPSDSDYCREDGHLDVYGDGQLSIITADGQTAQVDLSTGPTESCGCPSVFIGSVVVE